MNIWFMLWVFIAVFILGTSLWSYYILLKQKRSWAGFAKKHELEYVPVSLLKSPSMRGVYHGVPVTIYSDHQLSGSERQRGIRTVLLFSLRAPMPTEGAIASGSFRNFVNGLILPNVYVPEFEGWNKDILIKVIDSEAIAQYLTKERLGIINSLMVIKNTPVMLLFSAEDTILRVECSDPYDNGEKLERFLTKLADASKVLSLS